MYPRDARSKRRFGAVVISMVAIGVGVAGASMALADSAPGLQVQAAEADTLHVQQRVDLRCLTRRAEDCLDEPVPADEPHGAECAVCHNMYEQRTNPGEIRACTASGCHEDPLDLSPFHNTVSEDLLEDCSHCHEAHTFRVPDDGHSCAACHTGGGERVAWAARQPLRHLAVPGATFAHGDHDDLDCAACHGGDLTHGTLTIQGVSDCRTCHHDSSLTSDCSACHTTSEMAGLDLHMDQKLNINIGSVVDPVRWLPFDHERHTHTECAVCHTEGLVLGTGSGADCSTCHRDHHVSQSDCSVCHARPAEGAHDRNVHLGCSGDGCHDAPAAISGAPRTRELCLVCHRDRADHMVDRVCADCHVLPEVRGDRR